MTTDLVVRSSSTLSGQPMMTPDEWKVIAHQAGILSASRIIPKAYHNKPDEITAAALFGRDLGLSVIQSLNSLHVIEGKVGMSAELMSAIIRARGHSIDFDVLTDDEVTATGTRADTGKTFTFTWSRQHTADAGLAGKQVWKAYWRSMAIARVVSQIARTLFSDVLLGGGYSPEELAGIANREVEVDANGEVLHVIDLEPSESMRSPDPAAATQRIMESGTRAPSHDVLGREPGQRQADADRAVATRVAPLPASHTKVGAHDARAEQQKLDAGAAEAAASDGFETPTELFVAQLNADEAAMDAAESEAVAQSTYVPEPVAWGDETNQWSRHLPPHGFEYDRWAVKNAPEAPLSDDVLLHLQHTMVECGYAPTGREEAARKANAIIAERGAQKNSWSYMQMTKMNAHAHHVEANVLDPDCKSCQRLMAK